MAKQLEGKTAFIAGAGRNNGRNIALAYAREGADVILVAKQREEELKEVETECRAAGVKTLRMLADLTDYKQVNQAVEKGLDKFGRVDILASVAGMRPHKDFWEITYEEWMEVFAVNLHPTFFLAP